MKQNIQRNYSTKDDEEIGLHPLLFWAQNL